jgi:hypothetical protein
MQTKDSKGPKALNQEEMDSLLLAEGYTGEVEHGEEPPDPSDPIGINELSEAEIQSLMSAGDEADKVEGSINDALIAKTLLRRCLIKEGMLAPNDCFNWEIYYRDREEVAKEFLAVIIAESEVGFSDRDKERFAEIGIVTIRDLCLLSAENLVNSGFNDQEIDTIKSILYVRFNLFLMG